MGRDLLIAAVPIATGFALAVYIAWRSSRWLDDVDRVAAE